MGRFTYQGMWSEQEQRERWNGLLLEDVSQIVEDACATQGILQRDVYLAAEGQGFEKGAWDLIAPAVETHHGGRFEEGLFQRERMIALMAEIAPSVNALSAFIHAYVARVRHWLDETPVVAQYGKFGGYSDSSLHRFPWRIGPYTMWARNDGVTMEQVIEAAQAKKLQWIEKYPVPVKGEQGDGWYT